MKHTSQIHVSNYHRSQPVYPNAADTNYFSAKALEILAAIASGLGCVAGMVFLVILA